MAQRHGPQLRNLIYDKAFEAAGVMRSEVADPIKARSMIAPPTGRIDSCIPSRQAPTNHLAAEGVHRLSYKIDCGIPPKKAKAETCPSRNASVVSAG